MDNKEYSYNYIISVDVASDRPIKSEDLDKVLHPIIETVSEELKISDIESEIALDLRGIEDEISISISQKEINNIYRLANSDTE